MWLNVSGLIQKWNIKNTLTDANLIIFWKLGISIFKTPVLWETLKSQKFEEDGEFFSSSLSKY